MKVLFCGLNYEYGKPENGVSFEYRNFYEVLKNMEGVEAQFFATDAGLTRATRDGMNQKLIEHIKATRPDLLFCFLFTEELKKETIADITKNTKTKTFNWFADDHWRFANFSKYWAPLFTAVSTTDSQAVDKYKSIGVKVIKTQWAANIALYKPIVGNIGESGNRGIGDCDISFVGKNYGNRKEYLKALKSAGLKAEGFGAGWPAGRVDFQKLLEIFSSSKIYLNFTESSIDRKKEFFKLFVKKELGSYKPDIYGAMDNLSSLQGKMRRQIKGRIFEVPACGGFLLTGSADNLGDYYTDGREIVIFKGKEDLLEKCKYYLARGEERHSIAKAGYERTLKEHTYEKRFREIFKVLGLV